MLGKLFSRDKFMGGGVCPKLASIPCSQGFGGGNYQENIAQTTPSDMEPAIFGGQAGAYIGLAIVFGLLLLTFVGWLWCGKGWMRLSKLGKRVWPFGGRTTTNLCDVSSSGGSFQSDLEKGHLVAGQSTEPGGDQGAYTRVSMADTVYTMSCSADEEGREGLEIILEEGEDMHSTMSMELPIFPSLELKGHSCSADATCYRLPVAS